MSTHSNIRSVCCGVHILSLASMADGRDQCNFYNVWKWNTLSTVQCMLFAYRSTETRLICDFRLPAVALLAIVKFTPNVRIYMPCAPYALHFNVCAHFSLFFPSLPYQCVYSIHPRLRENIRHDARSWCHRMYDKIIRHMGIACALVVLFLSVHKKNSHFRLNVNICRLICLTIIIIIFDMIFYKNTRGVWSAYYYFHKKT